VTSTVFPWTVLAVTGVAALGVDLALMRRRQRLAVSVVTATGWTVAGLAFAAAVRAFEGTGAARDYLTVFLLEKSLSLDNVAVFAVVLSTFAVAAARRQRVLAGGIVAALGLRLAFVFAGLALIAAAHDVLVVFGVVLLVAGARMVRGHDGGGRPPRVVRWLRRRRVDPAIAALATIAVADLLFAVDSVPAAFAVTSNSFVIVAANLFAVLGLRPLYDLLAAAIDRLSHLERALGVLLALIGVALCLEPVWRVPEWVLLVAVVTTLLTGVLLSLVPPRRLLVSVGGGLLLAAGAAMLVLPGPGLLVVAAGLAVLATEFVWARRLLERVKARIPKRASR
jgi:tellurite resistance protein TerC